MDLGKLPSHQEQEQIINTQLVSAAEAGDIEQVELYLAMGASEKACSVALLGSLKSGHVNSELIIGLLVQNGVTLPPHAQVEEFSLAAASGDVEQVKLYLLAGVTEKACNKALIGAINSEHVDSIEIICLLKKNGAYLGNDAINQFFAAIKEGNYNKVFCFVTAGIEHAQVRNRQGQTALMVAAQHGHTEIIEYFCREGAYINDIQTDNEYQHTAIDFAAEHAQKTIGNCKALSFLMGIKDNTTGENAVMGPRSLPIGDYRKNVEVPAIVWASYYGLTDIIPLLLSEYGAMLDDVELATGKTALMWAVLQGHTQTAIELLELGANHDMRTDKGANLIELAIQKKNATFVSYLLEHKEFGFVADNKLLEQAIKSGCAHTVKVVLDVILAAEKTNAIAEKDSIRKTSSFLFQAVSLGHADIVYLLLKQGFAIDHVNPDNHPTYAGKTPLWAAVYFNKIEAVDVLLKAYADRVYEHNKMHKEKIEIDPDIEKHINLRELDFRGALSLSSIDIKYRFLSSLPTKRVNQLGDTLAFESSVNAFKVEMHKVRTKMLAMLGVPEKKIPAPVMEKSFWETMVSHFWSVIDMMKNAFGFAKPVVATAPILAEIQPKLDNQHSILSMLPAELISMVIWREFPFWYQHRVDKDVNFVCQSIQSVLTAKKSATAEKAPREHFVEVEAVLQQKPEPVVFSSRNEQGEIKDHSEKNLEQNTENSVKEPKTKVHQPS